MNQFKSQFAENDNEFYNINHAYGINNKFNLIKNQ